jgi:hypothetical protein
MRQVRWASWMAGAAAAALALCGAGPAGADVVSDQAAAIVYWPDVVVEQIEGQGYDTVIQLSNTSAEAVNVHCFYENANAHCTNTGEVCFDGSDCCDGPAPGCGLCAPGWNEIDFRARLTPRQPLGWRATEGLSEFPLSGRPGQGTTGPDGSSNANSHIPPVPENPFFGALKCIAVDSTGVPVDRNVLKGETTLVFYLPGVPVPQGTTEVIAVAKSNALGIQAIPGAVNDDKTLVLGGPDAEYNGCPQNLVLDHFFDGAVNPVGGGNIFTRLVLVPCTEDLLRQVPGSAVVQYLVFNEFEQRFSTSRPMTCKQDLDLSEIDTTQGERSIFSAPVAGTLTGQTRLTAIGSGLLGIATEFHAFPGLAEFNIHVQGDRPAADTIILP